MYLYLGNGKTVKKSSVSAIFDLDTITTNQKSNDFIKNAQKNNVIETVGTGIPKSLVLVNDRGKNKIYMTQFSVSSLKKSFELKLPI